MQLPELKKKYLLYENYKGQQITDIFDEKQIRTSAKSTVYTTETSVALNNGKGTFALQPLPKAAQFAPIYALSIADIDKDGHLDILMGGNLHRSKPELGIYDGSYGLLLKGNGQGGFEAMPSSISGFSVKGEIRDIAKLAIGNTPMFLIGRNNKSLLFYQAE